MRIAYLLGSLNRGGTETLLLDCFRNADQAGFPFIGIYRKEGFLSEEFKKTGVPLYPLAPSSKTDIGYLLRLRKLLVANRITTVHAQQPLDAIYARLATIGTGIKVALTFHGYDLEAGKVEKNMIRWIIKRTDLTIFVSNAQKEHYRSRYSFRIEKTTTVYNGISFEKLVTDESSDLRKELGINKETLLLGSIGNFGAVRDQLTVCKFVKLLSETNTDFQFVFVGQRNPGEEWRYDQCVSFCEENGLKEKVRFLGSRSDVPSILKQLNTFIYSTDHDTFGIAVIEAMACSLPVFVNDWEVMKEITENGKYAHLYKTKDHTDLLNQFLPFIVDKKQYKKEAEAAALWARDKYSIQKHLLLLEKVYKQMK